ncbi:glycosyltransferase family 2 protein [Bacillus sp. FJAT-29937]|uniref:glycosyltransferase family 2 protein n=1 Tax=Bacillus sp. FJAT-29937 TaxID=1720553 RepID=UPI0008378DF4|nr:glycosyltransferase family 2 protein [Bacillus sp. FJAT-29937]
MPTVSVQIVTFNSEEVIKNCLDSVFNQSFPLKEVIIVDNQSSDQTLNVVSAFDNVTLIKNNINRGFAGGHNLGINQTNSDYILVLNPDVILNKDYIKSIIEEMEYNKKIGLATGKLYRNFNGQILDSTGIIIKKNRRAFDRGSGEFDQGQYDQLKDIFGVSGAAAMYRRKMIEDVSIDGQFFDETFFAYKEDVDVSWRAQLLGWKSLFVPGAIAVHSRGWQEEKKRSHVPLFIRQKSYINRYFCILKNDVISRFVCHFPIIIVYEILSFAYAVLKEREIFSAWRSFITEYKAMKQKRKFVMNKRKSSNKHIYSYFKGIW